MQPTRAWSRRTFLISGLLVFAVPLPATRGAVAPLPAARDLGQGPCATATPRAVLAGASEPGTRLLVRGRLFTADGERPAAGAILYAYQTDATGVYNTKAGPPRLRGFMKTDADGRFEYDTIRPGSYPGTANAAHVHHQAWGGGFPAQWISDLNFADDPFVSAADRARSEAGGRFAWVRSPRREGDRLVIDLNLRLKAEGTRFDAGILHGREACGLG
jgi:protocatechuate 3,4-dioxygenase beta subunit